MSERKTIGILGGMGPAATADLFQKIVRCTKASRDQEHPHVIIDSNTNIPDRTDALLHSGASPVAELQKSARRLVGAGAEIIAMPCNTAHGYYDEVCAAAGVPVLHMIRLTAASLAAMGIKCAGLLATDGTVQTGIYEKSFLGSGIRLITPDEAGQRAVMDLTYSGVKAGALSYDTSEFMRAAERLLERGAETLILGCTELPPAFEMYGLELPHVDPTEILARAAVSAAGYETL